MPTSNAYTRCTTNEPTPRNGSRPSADPLSALNRRDFLKRGGAGLAGAALLGPRASRASSNEPTEITFSFGPDDTNTLQALIDAFNREHEGRIRVTWKEMARETDAYFRQLQNVFEEQPGTIDVIGSDSIWTPALAIDKQVVRLSRRFFDAYEPEDFLNAAMGSATYRYNVWAVPWYTAAGMLYYRQDLLEASGYTQPPATWDELKEMARAVQQRTGTRYGYVFQGAEYEGGAANAFEYIWNAGGRILAGSVSVAGAFGQNVMNPNVVAVNSEDTIRGLDIARSMITDGIAPEAVTSYREQECWRAFIAGEAVFMRNWPFAYSILSSTMSRIKPEQVGLAPLPSATPELPRFSCLGGWNLAINAQASNRKRDAAWTFIRFATSVEQQQRRAETGGFLPTLRRLYDDPDLLNAVPVMQRGRSAIQSARERPASPLYMQMSPYIARAFTQTLRGTLTPREAVRTLQDELQTILRENRL